MGLLLVGIIVAGACGGACFATMLALRKTISAGASTEMEKVMSDIDSTTKSLKELLIYKDSYASKPQFEKIESLFQGASSDLEKEKATLKEIEGKLDHAQKQVGEKETQQQEIKSAKSEDENKLQDLLTKHEELSNEAISLEQKLAQSMKNLDSLLNELELTSDQKAILQQLSDGLTAAGSRIRELLTEYNSVHERLEMLKQQHLDLEDEYTKLVEQQLGD